MKTVKNRRRSNKTDYKKRLGMLKSGKPRLVFRKTGKHVIAQYVSSSETKDRVEIGFNSKQLLKYGWPKELSGSLKSLPAAYLTGLLIGKRILKEKKETPIIDLGMLRTIHKSKIFAFIKGAVDSGLEISHNGETFPDESRIKGEHMKKDFSENFNRIKSQIEKEN